MDFTNKYFIIFSIIILIFIFWYFFSPNTVDNFDTSNDVPVIINFNTSWCGYSKQFQPNWDKFTSMIGNKIKVIDMKCDLEENKQKCNAYGITGYPTVKLYKNGNAYDYNGDRTPNDLVAFVNQYI